MLHDRLQRPERLFLVVLDQQQQRRDVVESLAVLHVRASLTCRVEDRSQHVRVGRRPILLGMEQRVVREGPRNVQRDHPLHRVVHLHLAELVVRVRAGLRHLVGAAHVVPDIASQMLGDLHVELAERFDAFVDQSAELLAVAVFLRHVEDLPAIPALPRELERQRLHATDALEKALPAGLSVGEQRRVRSRGEGEARGYNSYCFSSTK